MKGAHVLLCRGFRVFTFLLLVWLLPASFISAAMHVEDSAATRAAALTLWQHPTWHALLHYHPERWSRSGYRSYVDDARFFFSELGESDAQAEMYATLAAMQDGQTLNDEHPICRFPYRYQWLQEQLRFRQSGISLSECRDYQRWRQQVNAHSVTLVFPAAYLNSPSSMFGHTLFRFDPENVEKGSDWLSYALNFGANVNMQDNSIFFAYRGLAGGYPGVYNMMRYFEKIQEYNQLENRDMWEYRLNLTAHEVDKILMHVWELKDINFDYYFLDENCSYRLLELLELARPEARLTSRFTITAIPANTVRAVIDEKFVRSKRFRPSASTTLQFSIETLSLEQQGLARSLADDIAVLESDAFLALSDTDQAAVIDVAYRYLRYQQLQVERDEGVAKRSHALLIALNQRPKQSALDIKEPSPPESGHKTRMTGLGLGYWAEQPYAQWHFRYTYHDLLDDDRGYLRAAEIAAGNLEVRAYEDDGLKIQRFDIIDIISMSPNDTFFDRFSWQVKTGYERVFTGSGDAGAYQVNGGVGYSKQLGENAYVYGFGTARVEHNLNYKAFLTPAAGLNTGYLWYTPLGAQQLDVRADYFVNDDVRAQLNWAHQYNLNVNHGLRINLGQHWVKNDDWFRAELSYRYYF